MARKIVTWVVVADGTHARIYANDGPRKGLRRALERDYEAGLPHYVRDILTDRRGSNAGGPGAGRHAMDAKTDPRRHVANGFARSIAAMLGEAAQERFFDRLILVAPPKALGDLRAALPKPAGDRVTGTLDKDLVKHDEASVARHLADSDLLL
ncbi:MAG: host attachment protein [Alphaproteobacteria bacterium]|nr:host attachment protein [Alphaproteobacteria bacterium]